MITLDSWSHMPGDSMARLNWTRPTVLLNRIWKNPSVMVYFWYITWYFMMRLRSDMDGINLLLK
jgi:hypothetical protein